uniref:Lysosomal Pro-X carboxypeptidase n=1 Tax=Panagrellus redivivus TaxID=6233 RepID=A0A7E4VBZ4_PANRE
MMKLYSVCIILLAIQPIFAALSDIPFKKPNRFHLHRKLPQYDNVNDGPKYNYTITYYPNMPVDHLKGSTQDTFALRYFYNLEHYKPGGPLFFYTGNEGYLESFAQNTGIMFDLAPLFGAALLFGEHRFYGYSYPYGNKSYSDIRYLRYFDVDQVFGDYVTLIRFFKRTQLKDTDAKVILFGGSYGGMLASWFRVAYPSISVGAWSSSAPDLYFPDTDVSVFEFSKLIKNTFQLSGCDPSRITNGWNALNNLTQTDEGRAAINRIFKLDNNSLVTSPYDYDFLVGWIETAISYMAMTDYPYSSSFLAPMPAWPVEVACTGLMETDPNTDEGLVAGLYAIANVYYNGTGTIAQTCFDKCADEHDALGSPDGWFWQTCTQITIQMCDAGPPNDLFFADCTPDNVNAGSIEECRYFEKRGWTKSMYNPKFVQNRYGFSFANATNIVFTSGKYDPWYSGCIKRAEYNLGDAWKRGIFVYEIDGSAHHLDLRQPNVCDPDNISNVRYQITEVLWCWAYPNDAKCANYPTKPKDLPAFAKKDADCRPVFNGYPWGQA